MKVLISIMQGLGHLNSVIPLARALQGDGHEVVFICAPSFHRVVESVGFRAVPLGIDWLQVPADRRQIRFDRQHLPEAPVPAGFDWHWQRQGADQPHRDQSAALPLSAPGPAGVELDGTPPVGLPILASRLVEGVLPDMLQFVKDWQPDVIVRNDLDYAAYLAGESCNIPYATVGNNLLIPNAVLQVMIGPSISAARQRYGLPPDPDLESLNRYLYLSFTPASYQSPLDVIPTLHFIRPSIEDSVFGQDGLLEWINDLADQPTVYITLGTMFNRTPAIFETILAGLREEALNLIVTVGQTQSQAPFGAQPTNVHIEHYIPMNMILPYCDAVVCHGGSNTVMTTLSHGLPMFIVPIAADQPFHAQRCAELGLGLTMVATNLKPEAIRVRVRRLLEEASFRAAAKRLQREITEMPGPEYAVALLKQLAKERQPIVTKSAGR